MVIAWFTGRPGGRSMKARLAGDGVQVMVGRNSLFSDCELRFLLYVVRPAARQVTTSCVSGFEP